MFSKAKDKTKIVSLKLWAKVNNTNTSNMATDKTVSLANIPIADTHGVVAAPQDGIPGLYATGKAPKPNDRPTAKKSLRFEDNSDIPPALTPSAPPPELSPDNNEADDEIITEHDTATQTIPTVPSTVTANKPGAGKTAESTKTTTTDTSESPEEGATPSITPSQGVGRPLQ